MPTALALVLCAAVALILLVTSAGPFGLLAVAVLAPVAIRASVGRR